MHSATDNQEPINLDLLSDNDLVDKPVACRLIGGSHTPIDSATLYRGIKAGRFPAPLKISPKISRWRVGELRNVSKVAATERAA